jgi:hypothetical protein
MDMIQSITKTDLGKEMKIRFPKRASIIGEINIDDKVTARNINFSSRMLA